MAEKTRRWVRLARHSRKAKKAFLVEKKQRKKKEELRNKIRIAKRYCYNIKEMSRVVLCLS